LAVSAPLRVGFSPCPNDTFAFHALTHGLVPFSRAVELWIADIEALNERALGTAVDLGISKVSIGALAHLGERVRVLNTGAALGFGCGPLVVTGSQGPRRLGELAGCRVAVPGAHTTAFLLLAAFAPEGWRPVQMRFDRVMPAVAAGEVDAGVVIHEGRFTYERHGLRAIADLGQAWEAQTGDPLPLGVIVAHALVSDATARDFEAALGRSVAFAWAHPDASRPWVEALARELTPEVVDRHIALYVNEFTADLGSRGWAALQRLLERAHGAGLVPASALAVRRL
jgi:1,4-dihydroxy-6-naphthoate synthase